MSLERKYFAEDWILNTIEALARIRELRETALDKRRFTGYSGKSKIAGGFMALATAFFLSSRLAPAGDTPRLISWLLLGMAAMSVNYLAIFRWYGRLEEDERRLARLVPVLDALPSIIVGMALTWALVAHSAFDLLFGMWMSLYGLTHLSNRIQLPKEHYVVGIFYLASGLTLLAFPPPFANPWPMGLVFFVGELVGGIILERNRRGAYE